MHNTHRHICKLRLIRGIFDSNILKRGLIFLALHANQVQEAVCESKTCTHDT